jgi:hypothetical protein
LPKIRPRQYLQEFLRRVSKKFSLFGYSAADPDRATFILLRFLTPMIRYVIPKTNIKNGIKEISELMERYKKVVIVDDNPKFIPKDKKVTPMVIKTWGGRSKDDELRRIANELKV